jgi:hypothetical protein
MPVSVSLFLLGIFRTPGSGFVSLKSQNRAVVISVLPVARFIAPNYEGEIKILDEESEGS